MKLNTVIVAIIIAAAAAVLLATVSCQKQKVQVTAKPETNNAVKKAISGERQSYDYSQPVEQIIADAIAGDPNARRISEAQINAARIKRGKYIDVNKDWYACFPEPAICMVILPDIVIHSSSLYSVTGGTNENPIGIIEALPSGPKLRLVSEVSFEYSEDNNVTYVHPTYLSE